MRNLDQALIPTLFFLIPALVFCACGGGGGGGGGGSDFGYGGTGFGFSNIFGNTTGAGTSNEYPILNGVNLPIVLYFNEEIDPATVNGKSVSIVTIDVPDEEDPEDLVQQPGGIPADVEFIVQGANLYIKPTLKFSKPEGNPVYGFLPHAAYEIRFTQPPSENVVTSKSGKKIEVPQTGKPIAFITTDKVYDEWPGPPQPSFFIYDEDTGSWNALEKQEKWYDPNAVIAGSLDIPVQPMPLKMFRIYFSEPVLRQWGNLVLVNASDGTSDVLKVVYYEDFPNGYTQPVDIPGTWFFVQEKLGESYVEFWPSPSLDTFPEDKYIFLVAEGQIADLAGNVKGLGNDDVTTLHTTGQAVLDDMVEDFSTDEYEDKTATSAIWGEYIEYPPGTFNYYLAGGGGGGTGEDGLFFPPGNVPSDATVDASAKVVYLPVAEDDGGTWVVRDYNFTSFTVPFGWTVKPELPAGVPAGAGRFPLTVHVTGKVRIDGVVDVSGEPGEDGTVGQDPEGTAGGASPAGGGAGGQGGSVPTGAATHTLPLEWDFGGEFQEPPDQDKDIQGITGTIEELGEYYLVDTKVNFRSIETWIKDQMLQPNVGMGAGNDVVVTNHPTFYVKRVDPVDDHKIWVWGVDPGDENDPRYKGALNAISNNPGLPPPPIAKVGDPYLVGYLRGFDGEDASVFQQGGRGGDPLSVAQTILTLAGAGSGGGGGGSSAGLAGQTAPDYDQTMGGYSTPDSLGGAGGGLRYLAGTVTGVTDNVTFTVDQDLGTWDLAGYRVNPNYQDADPATTNDWIFTIVSNTSDTIVVKPLEDAQHTYDLLTTEVGAQAGRPFILYPPEDMGGVGGGGSGLELTGTYKTTFQPPFQLPRWLNGAGGGGGGGVLIMETARTIEVMSSGAIYARGGRGGILSGLQVHLPRGGGGGGGSIILRAVEGITVKQGGVISTEGGAGVVIDENGTPVSYEYGGTGFIRLETKENDLDPSGFDNGRTVPEVEEKDLGKFIPSSLDSLGLSTFYGAGVIKPVYQSVEVHYLMDVDGVTVSDVYPGGTYDDPPFTFVLNVAEADPKTGKLDLTSVDEDFVDIATFLGNPDLYFKPYVRFKINLETEKNGAQGTYKKPRIERVIIKRTQAP